MDKIAFFDYASIVIFGLLIVSCITRKMLKGRQNNDFLGLLIIAFLTTVFDALAITFDRAGAGFTVEKYIFHTLYLFFHCATLPYYMIFIVDLTGYRHKTVKNPTYRVLMAIPLELEAFVLVLNLFTHKMFFFDENGVYTRGPLFFVNYLVAAFYLAACIVQLVKFRRVLPRVKFFSIFAMFPAITVAVIIQFLFPRLLIEMFVIAMCFLFVSTVVIRPEENIDADTGFLRMPAYVDALKKLEVTGKHVGIIMVNISNYRSLYRSLGYGTSSKLAEQIARMISKTCGEKLIGAEYYYLGNGKFRIVVENEDRPVMMEIGRNLQTQMSEGFMFRTVEIALLANVCVVYWPEDINDEKSMMLFGSQMDEMPYRNGIVFAKEIMKQKNFDIIKSLDTILEDALNYRMFEVYYQPIYSVKEKKFTTAEALIRLKTEEFGFIPPDLFIPVAEQNGTIHRIGHYVLDEVCRFIAEEGFDELGVKVIDVNLSTVQCLEKNLAKEISMILGSYNVDPSRINLEITETAASFEYSEMISNIENLSARGFKFSLDDYGTGYSNISRAVGMPLSIIKLDKSLTHIEDNMKLISIGEHTIRMIKDMDMEIVAEGIEDEATLLKFEEMGCDFIQGYYFSRPLPKDQFVAFIKEKNLGIMPEGKEVPEAEEIKETEEIKEEEIKAEEIKDSKEEVNTQNEG